MPKANEINGQNDRHAAKHICEDHCEEPHRDRAPVRARITCEARWRGPRADDHRRRPGEDHHINQEGVQEGFGKVSMNIWASKKAGPHRAPTPGRAGTRITISGEGRDRAAGGDRRASPTNPSLIDFARRHRLIGSRGTPVASLQPLRFNLRKGAVGAHRGDGVVDASFEGDSLPPSKGRTDRGFQTAPPGTGRGLRHPPETTAER